jgi:hypothetical protein
MMKFELLEMRGVLEIEISLSVSWKEVLHILGHFRIHETWFLDKGGFLE